MQSMRPNVVYVLPDKMGGVLNIVSNLLAFRHPDGFDHHVMLVHNTFSKDTRGCGQLTADQKVMVEHKLPLENLHSVLRRLADAIPKGPGVLVSNDWIELAMLVKYDLGRTVIQILHGDDDYYYGLAVRHEAVIDVFVAYSRTMYESLRCLLPHRRESIFHLPYGIPICAEARSSLSGPLRLIFAGRLENGQKGIYDLPEIDRYLVKLGSRVAWTIVGGGPHEKELRTRWQDNPSVRWLGVRSNPEVMRLYKEHDVFVLPTRSEGFPVALLEAMGAGVVPVVSDISSGVPQLIEMGRTGYRPSVGNIEEFAVSIAELDHDRERLDMMSRACRATVIAHFNIEDRIRDYQSLYARYDQLRRPRAKALKLLYGSRLDQPWIPNSLVWAARSASRFLGRQPLSSPMANRF